MIFNQKFFSFRYLMTYCDLYFQYQFGYMDAIVNFFYEVCTSNSLQ